MGTLNREEPGGTDSRGRTRLETLGEVSSFENFWKKIIKKDAPKL